MEDLKVIKQNLDSEDWTLETENIYGDNDDSMEQNTNEVVSFNTIQTDKTNDMFEQSEISAEMEEFGMQNEKSIIEKTESNQQGIKPFKFDVCQDSFSSKQSMKEHKNSVHLKIKKTYKQEHILH